MTRQLSRRRLLLVAATLATATLAACSSPTAPDGNTERSGGTYGGSSTKMCGGTYGGSSTC